MREVDGAPAPPEETEGTVTEEARGRPRRRLVVGVLAAFVLLALAGLYEVRTSFLQALLFPRLTEDFAYRVEPGPSDRIRFPEQGPYDIRFGYTRIPELSDRLDSLGFELAAQARISEALARTIEWGAYPVYREKSAAGLRVSGRSDRVVVEERFPARAYPVFDSIPEPIWRSLLYIESQNFLDPRYPRRNPAVEWDRLAIAAGELAVRSVGVDRNVPGGSTLATQIEKFRHSPQGLTRSPRDKLRQMLTASLRAYQDGPDTREERRRIVRAYLNSVPLAAQGGHGEVVGTADGLWAWYGTDFDEANRVLRSEPTDSAARRRRGEVYRQAVSLLVAHRRPTHYLASPDGRLALADLTDAYLRLFARDGVVDGTLAGDALAARDAVALLARAPVRAPRSFTERKAATLVRNQLLQLTGVPSFYELDRLDIAANAAIDPEWHRETTDVLQGMSDRSFLRQHGFLEDRLLASGDPSGVLYSVLLLERTERGNEIRIQTDNFDGPMSLANASRLELGSTAKLRTLVTYLEVVEEAYAALSALPRDSLAAHRPADTDVLSRWVRDRLLARPDLELEELLDGALVRSYSASPAERFVTGGGTQTFANFDATFDGRILTVRESFRNSVNLPFIRIMRDVVRYEMFRGDAARVLDEREADLRADYLRRFADAEGSDFVRRFHRKYQDRTGPEIFDALLAGRRLGHQRLAWAVRTVAPNIDEERFAELVRANAPDESVSDQVIADVYRTAEPSVHTLSDLGYLARVHPLELWVAAYALHHPGSTLQEHLTASRDVRIEVYDWLFRTGRRNAQDQRIRTVLEIEAFQRVLQRWTRLGYPFANIVPSLGTAIGSSGDRPMALAELAGIIQSGGIRRPTVGITSITAAAVTPYETRFERRPVEGRRVMSEAVAAALGSAMEDVVENGTGRRVRGSLVGSDGEPLVIGGKTGTGDNRFRVFGPGGRLLETRTVNRTATFVFMAGDRYFGVIVAYVDGPSASSYRFTSALPTQLLRVLGERWATL